MMLDEFPSLAGWKSCRNRLLGLAGYGIKCYLICQDINQLKSSKTGYGQDESITSNCHIQAAFPPNRRGNRRTPFEAHWPGHHRQETNHPDAESKLSRTLQETQRSLLTVDECLRMPGPSRGPRMDAM